MGFSPLGFSFLITRSRFPVGRKGIASLTHPAGQLYTWSDGLHTVDDNKGRAPTMRPGALSQNANHNK